MVDFSSWLDLPLIWGILIATAVFLYVILDGFDLGCGILFPFAPSDKCRDRMMNSIAPFWDGNETWLILGGGGLFVAFPVAYSILFPAFYMPIILMLIGLIFRGVAFEFRFKAGDKDRVIWDISFHGGSLLAAFMQGLLLGNFIQGVEVTNRSFSGGPLDWANGFAIITGISLVFGYILLGACWLILKTDGETQKWARKTANYSLVMVMIAMAIVSGTMPFVQERIKEIWFSTPNIYYMMILPLVTAIVFFLLWKNINNDKSEVKPMAYTLVIFLLGFLGMAISMYPWIVPYEFTLWDAAALPTAQSFVLIGTVIMLPAILGYTAYSYYIFWGKASDESHY